MIPNARLGDLASGLTLNGGTLLPTTSFTLPRAITMGAAGGSFDTNGLDLTLSTAVSGPGGLAKNGIGILTLSGANSYAGGTTVNAGMLRLAPGASLFTTGPLAVNGGILDLNGNNLAIGSLLGLGGRIELGASTLTVAEQGNTSFAGILTGTGGLTMQGPGDLSLAGANTYTGPTNVTGGRLAIDGSITSDVTVGAGGNLGGSGTHHRHGDQQRDRVAGQFDRHAERRRQLDPGPRQQLPGRDQQRRPGRSRQCRAARRAPPPSTAAQ